MCLRIKTCMLLRPLLFVLLVLLVSTAYTQNDTTIIVADSVVADGMQAEKVIIVAQADTGKKAWSPAKKAAIYSAVLPGAGQVYNRKYWKVPLVYGALAIPGYYFVDNLTYFKRARYAYNYLHDRMTPPANLADTFGVYSEIHDFFKVAVDNRSLASLQNARNQSRQNVDYSALFFILLWGLNVVDAAVDGHLKDFDISDDLSIRIKPGHMPIGNTTGIGIVLNIGKNHVNRNYSR